MNTEPQPIMLNGVIQAHQTKKKLDRRSFLWGVVAGAAGLGIVTSVIGYYEGGNVFEAGRIYQQDLEHKAHNINPSQNEYLPKQSDSGPKVGEPAPDFALTGLDGKVYSLSHYKGMPVVINFFETWCGPCREEMPTIENFAKLYQGRVAVLTITNDDNNNTKSYIEKHNYSAFEVLIDKSRKTKKAYDIETIPRTFIVNKDGVLYATHPGVHDFSRPRNDIIIDIEKLLSGSKLKISPMIQRF